jgi:hypothetical protein
MQFLAEISKTAGITKQFIDMTKRRYSKVQQIDNNYLCKKRRNDQQEPDKVAIEVSKHKEPTARFLHLLLSDK